MSQRRQWATQTDAHLLAQCEVDTYRASGPGGQKRNKTSSAVRLRHVPTGLIVIAEESRSQHENKAKALRRLRQSIWLEIRNPFDQEHPDLQIARSPDGRFMVRPGDERYLPAVAVILDAFDVHRAILRDVVSALATTTGNLVHFLGADDRVWRTVNAIRTRHGQTPLQS